MNSIQDIKSELKEKLAESIDYSRESSDEEIRELIDDMLIRESKKVPLSLTERDKLRRELFHAIRKLDVLQEFVDDPQVTEIMVNGPDNIFVERGGRLYKSDLKFENGEKLQNVVQQIVSDCNRVVNEASPIVDARLQNGARVNVVLNPVALNGPILTIRRFPDKPITMENLISFGSVTSQVCEWLGRLVKAKYNIFISGGTGSGKIFKCTVPLYPCGRTYYYNRRQRRTADLQYTESGTHGDQKCQCGRMSGDYHQRSDQDITAYEAGPDYRRGSKGRGSL